MGTTAFQDGFGLTLGMTHGQDLSLRKQALKRLGSRVMGLDGANGQYAFSTSHQFLKLQEWDALGSFDHEVTYVVLFCKLCQTLLKGLSSAKEIELDALWHLLCLTKVFESLKQYGPIGSTQRKKCTTIDERSSVI